MRARPSGDRMIVLIAPPGGLILPWRAHDAISLFHQQSFGPYLKRDLVKTRFSKDKHRFKIIEMFHI